VHALAVVVLRLLLDRRRSFVVGRLLYCEKESVRRSVVIFRTLL
jgi:hypothetical protein